MLSTDANPLPSQRGPVTTPSLIIAGTTSGAALLVGCAYVGYRVSHARLQRDVAAVAAPAPSLAPPASPAPPAAPAARGALRAPWWRVWLPGPGATRSPAALALKAFAYGSLLSLATFGAASFALTYYLHTTVPRPPFEDYRLTGRDVHGLSAEDRATVVDFGLWLDEREVSDELKRDRARAAAAAASGASAAAHQSAALAAAAALRALAVTSGAGASEGLR
jgi:hypothetical protein